MKSLSGLSDIANQYDAFIIDLWGVVHDGSALYPQARGALEAIHAAGKPVCFLSNAPRRAARAQATLDTLKIPRELYANLITSGEVAWKMIREKRDPFFARLGKRYYFIGPARDQHIGEGLPCEEVANLQDADFLFNAGFKDDPEHLSEFEPIFEKAIDRKLPMLCINPDREIIKLTGKIFPCAGLLGEHYVAKGGECRFIGKPYPEVYEEALSFFGAIAKPRILAIGDNPDTDIQGANQAGIDSLLILDGVPKEEGGGKADYALPIFVY